MSNLSVALNYEERAVKENLGQRRNPADRIFVQPESLYRFPSRGFFEVAVDYVKHLAFQMLVYPAEAPPNLLSIIQSH